MPLASAAARGSFGQESRGTRVSPAWSANSIGSLSAIERPAAGLVARNTGRATVLLRENWIAVWSGSIQMMIWALDPRVRQPREGVAMSDNSVDATRPLLLVPHGSQKLSGWFGGSGIAGTEQFFASRLGLPPWVAVLAGLVEFGGGLQRALGLVTRVAAVLVMGLMMVAVIQVHLPYGFFWTRG